jgi:hypothetical protein
MASFMEQFQELGELVENRWRKENYSEQLFPEICAQALGEADLPSRIDPWDIVRWVLSSFTLPDQKDAGGRFGDPPITVFAGSRFYIDVYYWLDGTTSIHQHAFCGAFQVLLGSSIHSHYDFEERSVISEHFSVGELRLREVQLLKLGDIKEIRPGRQYIHSLFHLDRPSATITIRTEHTPSAAVQYDYRKPYFAVNPFYKNILTAKKVQTIALLLGMNHKEADSYIGDVVASSDFHTAYLVLVQAAQLRNRNVDELFGMSIGKERFEAILDRARSTHCDLVDLILPVLDEQDRQQNITQRRNSIIGEEHRFFMALLLNVASREKVLELVKQRFPEVDPVEKILDWVEELGQARVLGSKEPNALGIEGFDDNYLITLEGLLQGLSDEEIKGQHQQSTANIVADSPAVNVDEILRSLRSSPLFRQIFEPPKPSGLEENRAHLVTAQQ